MSLPVCVITTIRFERKRYHKKMPKGGPKTYWTVEERER
jgi:hypothetical protein